MNRPVTWRVFGLAWSMQKPKLSYSHSIKGKQVRTVLPYSLVRLIVHVWNWVACRVVGHDHILDGITETYDSEGCYPCSDCSKRFKGR